MSARVNEDLLHVALSLCVLAKVNILKKEYNTLVGLLGSAEVLLWFFVVVKSRQSFASVNTNKSLFLFQYRLGG